MIPFNFHHLYYFYKVAEEGSISKAAKTLRLSQPTLSLQLKQIEDYFGIKLFDREGKRLQLTGEGNFVLSYAKSIFDMGRELYDGLNDRSRRGYLKVQIGVTGSVPKSISHAVLNFLLDAGNTFISVHELGYKELLDQLRVHNLDMILSTAAYQGPAEDGIQSFVLAQLPIAFCANKQWAKSIRKVPQDLHDKPMLLTTSQHQIYQQLREYFLTHKIKPRVIAEIQDAELVRRLVIEGKGIAPLNLYTIHKAPAKESIHILGSKPLAGIHETIYALTKDRKTPHPYVRQLIENFKIPPQLFQIKP